MGPCEDAPVVEISGDSDVVVLRMSPREAELLSVALQAGYEAVSRAEYWIRNGVTENSVRALSGVVYEVATGERASGDCTLESGVEAEENPLHPRPQM